MSSWGKAATWSMLVIALLVFIAATIVLGSTISKMFELGTIKLSIFQIGILCGGVTGLSVFVRCVKQLKNCSESART